MVGHLPYTHQRLAQHLRDVTRDMYSLQLPSVTPSLSVSGPLAAVLQDAIFLQCCRSAPAMILRRLPALPVVKC